MKINQLLLLKNEPKTDQKLSKITEKMHDTPEAPISPTGRILAVMIYSNVLKENIVLALDRSAKEQIYEWAKTLFCVVYWTIEVERMKDLSEEEIMRIHCCKNETNGWILPENYKFPPIIDQIKPKTA